ncbi:adipocyte enhancer-binding protein 1-like [Mya arenaria]|uniref:adipocyte enhancer-binding protein 1-like n=1 Tax=Mya arenaria TaxID=6604 RepID=UPI0022E0158D|nr:adipocyte enhancer-binding protein 1-like [Mya arenaria]XP_052818321.1 adipocyte enhancer-binding protein 1-like [Mya arenaria]
MCHLATRKCRSRICGYDKVSKTCFYSFDTYSDLNHNTETTKVVIIPDGGYCYSTYYLLNGARQITASSVYSDGCDTRGARLYSVASDWHEGAWSAGYADTNQYIQVQFNCLNQVSGVALQGKVLNDQYVTSYRVLYSCDCVNFHTVTDTYGYYKTFAGNTDPDTVVTSMLPSPVTALCVRINPVTYKDWMSMRFEILGCPVNELHCINK